jgi:leucyl aminopeptidase
LLGSGSNIAIPVDPPVRGKKPVIRDDRGVLAAVGIDGDGLAAGKQLSCTAGDVKVIPVSHPDVDAVAFVGAGDGSHSALRKAAAALVRACRGARSIGTTLTVDADPDAVGVVAETLILAAYGFTLRQSAQQGTKLARVALVADMSTAAKSALRRAQRVAEAVCVARDLAMTPADIKNPAWLAGQASQLGEAAGLTVRTWDVEELAAEGFGGVLAVGAGSASPPRLVQLTYSPSEPSRHVVLVGKGITFDSGGLSLKPTESMVGMKTDMAGGAAVIATMAALPDLDVNAAVTALIPMAENMLGGDAARPGDVIRHYGGITSEVLNTDAEGRLVLADALAYAVENLAPDVIVDLATLTGAASLGLGKRHGALYATTDALATDLADAAASAGERLWRLPLVSDYRDALDSPIADLRNIGDPELEYNGGSIIAALFLREFVAGVEWAHLDIAGPARADADEVDVTKGATGFGVRTLLAWLSRQ